MNIWMEMREEAEAAAQREPLLATFYQRSVLRYEHFYEALSVQIVRHLQSAYMDAEVLLTEVMSVFTEDDALEQIAMADIQAYFERDPACDGYLKPLLFFKGFLAIQSHRVGHSFWLAGRRSLAYYMQSRASAVFDVDIHPAASLGHGIMFDHATGIVIGETARVGNNVSMLHGVSLGGSGVQEGKRHPTIGDGVLISVGAKLLGDIVIGGGVKIGGGSIVLGSVPDNATVVGVPAQMIGDNQGAELPAFSMDQYIPSSST